MVLAGADGAGSEEPLIGGCGGEIAASWEADRSEMANRRS